MPTPDWRRATRCELGNCVEVADLGATVAVRNSTTPDWRLEFPAPAWRAFIAAAKAGDFDR